MSSSPSVPSVPDPNTVAANQQNINNTTGVQNQSGSMVNQNNAYGSLTYNQTGTGANGTPLYTATTSLSPAQQQLLDTLTGTKQTAGSAASSLLSNANYGGANPGDVIGDATKGLTQQAMAQQTAYLKPGFDAATSQLDTQLRNQGFDPSSPAYKTAMNNLQQSQGQTVTGFLATMEPQMYAQAQSNYLLPAQLAGSLAGLGAPTDPNADFVQTPGLNINPANLEGDVSSANSANMAAYQAQLGQSNAMMSGLFGMGSAALGGLAKSGALSSLLGSAALAV